MSKNLDLIVVIPVYNEATAIVPLLSGWSKALRKFQINFKLLVLNDGSTDHSLTALKAFSDYSNDVLLIDKNNQGHGPTILMGYRIAVNQAKWVFQTDSDLEISPEDFYKLWEVKDNLDAVFGERTGRTQTLSRKLLSSGIKIISKVLGKNSIHDPNIPFRLVNNSKLNEFINRVNFEPFAPNVLMSIFAQINNWKVRQVKIKTHPRVGAVKPWSLIKIVKLLVINMQDLLKLLLSNKK